jgi:hypothetical protein
MMDTTTNDGLLILVVKEASCWPGSRVQPTTPPEAIKKRTSAFDLSIYRSILHQQQQAAGSRQLGKAVADGIKADTTTRRNGGEKPKNK